VCCVSKSPVSLLCREAKNGKEKGTEKVYLSPRKHINVSKRMTSLDDFQKDVFCRIVVKYYDKRRIPYAKKVTLALRERIMYKGSLNILFLHMK
jgi:hypothetical protein